MKQRCLSGGNFDLTNAREQNSSELTSAGWINFIGTARMCNFPFLEIPFTKMSRVNLFTCGNRNFTRISTYEIKN